MGRMPVRCFNILMIILVGTTFAAGIREHTVTILAGAESHGMIKACDCEVEPGGGVAKRATLIKNLRGRGELLLLDAGGFSAGGIYDSYTEGRRGDSSRTAVMITAMGTMGYDAVAIGDDDLQWDAQWLMGRSKKASLPLVSANSFTDDGKRVAEPYRIIKKGGMRIGVTAVTSRERLFPLAKGVKVIDPVTALKAIWTEMASQSEMQIILSHLGQAETFALADSFQQCALIVNGHRKSDKQVLSRRGVVPILQFGFQGKSLSGISVTNTKKGLKFGKARWYDVLPALADDPTVAGLVSQPVAHTQHTVYDLYIMSQCPYGLEALHEILLYSTMFDDVAWNIWFIGTVHSDSTLASLHGSVEVDDEKWWLAVQALYPQRWVEFLNRRVSTTAATEQIIRRMGCAIDAVKAWVDTAGTVQLMQQYNRSVRLNINASPTLLINNTPYGKAVTLDNLSRFYCKNAPIDLPCCDSVPDCSEDTECKESGKLGQCVRGTCEFRDAVSFTFTVMVADSTYQQPEEMIIRTTKDLFPGADVRIVGLSTMVGRNLMKEYQPTGLPLYLFGNEVKHAHNFSTVEKGLFERGTVLTFREGVVRENFYLQRPVVAGTVWLYIDPLFKGLPDIFTLLKSDSAYLKKVAIKPIIFSDPAAASTSFEEKYRQEEALRWMVLGSHSLAAKRAYLGAYAQNPASSYWNTYCKAAKITTDSLQALTSRSGAVLQKLWKELKSMSIREPAILLIDNRETVILNSERELRSILDGEIGR